MGRPSEFLRNEQIRANYKARAQASMARYMRLAEINESELAKRQGVVKQTIHNRLDNPGKMQVEDIWDMSIILKCPIGELVGGELPEEIIGRLLYKNFEKKNGY